VRIDTRPAHSWALTPSGPPAHSLTRSLTHSLTHSLTPRPIASIPETLARDAARLLSLQNEFQKCTVMAICMSVIQGAICETHDVVTMSRKRDAKGRIAAILDDPDVSIDHIAAEVASCMTELDLVEHLANMITNVLVSGNGDPAYVYDTCGRIGAAEIADDVVDLARRIGEVAAVSEAVCGPWYAKISAEFSI
jgi:hypothetical protein